MAVTYTVTESTAGRQRVGKQHVVDARLTLSGTYETGGFSVTASSLGLAAIESLIIRSAPWEGTEFYGGIWDYANSKIKLGWTGGATSSEFDEITNAFDVTNVVVPVEVKGR